jgi:hypothetical protein
MVPFNAFLLVLDFPAKWQGAAHDTMEWPVNPQSHSIRDSSTPSICPGNLDLNAVLRPGLQTRASEDRIPIECDVACQAFHACWVQSFQRKGTGISTIG